MSSMMAPCSREKWLFDYPSDWAPFPKAHQICSMLTQPTLPKLKLHWRGSRRDLGGVRETTRLQLLRTGLSSPLEPKAKTIGQPSHWRQEAQVGGGELREALLDSKGSEFSAANASHITELEGNRRPPPPWHGSSIAYKAELCACPGARQSQDSAWINGQAAVASRAGPWCGVRVGVVVAEEHDFEFRDIETSAWIRVVMWCKVFSDKIRCN
ncbi:hypothetical protein EI94DRAFT_1703679 [Lactarius quietus]|nr:hypothetical protein EI94DRAFT_1703679 [Lactarius quietus]